MTGAMSEAGGAVEEKYNLNFIPLEALDLNICQWMKCPNSYSIQMRSSVYRCT